VREVSSWDGTQHHQLFFGRLIFLVGKAKQICVSYEVIKTINDRRYRYSQETYREAGKVRTRNV
jgi:hypothetical protein